MRGAKGKKACPSSEHRSRRRRKGEDESEGDIVIVSTGAISPSRRKILVGYRGGRFGEPHKRVAILLKNGWGLKGRRAFSSRALFSFQLGPEICVESDPDYDGMQMSMSMSMSPQLQPPSCMSMLG
ncbi:hypothetical protein TWF696_008811 [Orbilia brochopaga]|uniref:Uncharacterized protein n=1 Tax=Orbilia brochopaga TaxID=3140254 RepID=A0AAV9UI31_9PEZI